MLKRLTGLVLAFAMMTLLIPGLAEEMIFDDEEEGTAAAAGEEELDFSRYSYEELTVGNPTPVEGYFFTSMWGNNTSDMDIRELLNAYSLVYWNKEDGLYAMNPASVSGTMVMDDRDGNRTYVITLYNDMRYSDGTEITARDYAFSILLRISPLITQLGGKPTGGNYILGCDDYVSGESKTLEGLRVVSSDELMITIRADYLPYFYEQGLLDFPPVPMHVIAPDCEVRDDGQGAWIEGDFTAELLKKTIMDPETGYLSHPSVVSGPYMLTSYEGTTVELEANPYYKGDTESPVPSIKKLRLVSVTYDDMMERLQSGEVTLLNKVARADCITQGTSLIGTGAYVMANYPRVGLAFISFCCEKPTVSSQAVRQALACCMDKDQLTADYTGNYGLKVNGYYGIGQWMYQILSGAVLYPVDEPEDESEEAQAAHDAELAAWEELSLDSIPTYELDVERANRLLDQDGWTRNEKNEDRGAEEIRHKQVGGVLVPLKLKMAVPEGTRIGESLEKYFVPHLKEAGAALELVTMPVDELLDQFYQRGDRTVDMIFLGSNFDTVFDPADYFKPAAKGETTWNFSRQTDEALYQAALDMRKTEPGDLLEYCTKWLAFQKRFAEVEPLIPLYSNVYFDFHSGVLHDYRPTENLGWSQTVLSAFLGDPDDAEEEESTEELGEDEMLFDD